MALLTKEEFYKGLGETLRNEREKRGLSRVELTEGLNQNPVDPERHLRMIAALSVMAGHIRRRKGLTRKQVAERGNLPVALVYGMEAGKILNPEMYLVYCISYGLRTSLSNFVKRADRLSRIELDENDRPIGRKSREAALPKSTPRLLPGRGKSKNDSADQQEIQYGPSERGGFGEEPPIDGAGDS